MKYRTLHRQRGIAIIFAVLMAALVAGLAFILAGRERLWLFQLENRKDYASALNIVQGAVNLARLTVRDDGRNNQVDHLAEPWNTPIPAINVEDGKVAGQMTELQGRFNLANLLQDGKLDQSAVSAFGRLLAGLGADQALAQALASWIEERLPDSDADSGSFQPPVELAELSAVSGFTPEIIRQIEPLVIWLPTSTAINVNFVAPEVLAAQINGMTQSDAQSILSSRSSKYFSSVSVFLEAVPQKWRSELSGKKWTVQSDYFLMTSESWFGRAYLRYQTLLRRNGRDIATVIWMKRVQDGR